MQHQNTNERILLRNYLELAYHWLKCIYTIKDCVSILWSDCNANLQYAVMMKI